VRPLRRGGEGPAEICELLHDEVVTKERDRQRDRDRLRDMAGLVKNLSLVTPSSRDVLPGSSSSSR